MRRTARVQTRLWHIYRRMDPAILVEEDPAEPGTLGLERSEGRTRLAWGTYTRAGLERALRLYGTVERLEEQGIGPLQLTLDLSDPFLPRLQLTTPRFTEPVAEAVLRRVPGRAVGLRRAAAEMEVLFLESLLLQNPGRSFTWLRPPLPGQQYPGLRLSSEILQLLILLTKRVGAQGLALRPSTFHAAVAYARHFRFVDGMAQARFERLRAEPRLRPLWLLSWALELGCVRLDGERVTWSPEVMIAPLDAALAQAIDTPGRRRVLRHRSRRRYAFDLGCLRRRFPWERMPPLPIPRTVQELLRPAGSDH